MVRPANGFVTDDGRYFDTQDEARYAEATTELIQCVQNDSEVSRLFSAADPVTIQYLLDHIMRFIHDYSDQIKAYINARDSLGITPEPDFKPNDLQNDELVRTVSDAPSLDKLNRHLAEEEVIRARGDTSR